MSSEYGVARGVSVWRRWRRKRSIMKAKIMAKRNGGIILENKSRQRSALARRKIIEK
jgi:hypothetical protein